MKFVTYNNVEIMVCDADEDFINESEFYVNDEVFSTIKAAIEFIDLGCPMSESMINVYRNGGF